MTIGLFIEDPGKLRPLQNQTTPGIIMTFVRRKCTIRVPSSERIESSTGTFNDWNRNNTSIHTSINYVLESLCSERELSHFSISVRQRSPVLTTLYERLTVKEVDREINKKTANCIAGSLLVHSSTFLILHGRRLKLRTTTDVLDHVDKFVRSLKRSKDVVRRNDNYVTIRLSSQGYRKYTRVIVMVVAIVMIGQFLDTAASINYSDDVAKAINFIGQRPGYGSSVPVTVALLQRRIPLCSLFHDYAPDQANTLLTLVVTRMPAAGKLRKTINLTFNFLHLRVSYQLRKKNFAESVLGVGQVKVNKQKERVQAVGYAKEFKDKIERRVRHRPALDSRWLPGNQGVNTHIGTCLDDEKTGQGEKKLNGARPWANAFTFADSRTPAHTELLFSSGEEERIRVVGRYPKETTIPRVLSVRQKPSIRLLIVWIRYGKKKKQVKQKNINIKCYSAATPAIDRFLCIGFNENKGALLTSLVNERESQWRESELRRIAHSGKQQPVPVYGYLREYERA
ncbi:hypothetical protein V1477_005011 [Vespula maculifrons]|uniref:Ribosomal protein S3 n=1 Tax=Vespula maculifrons TaxID=7453 RepID=A0ABD2CNP6_VESMC